MKYPRISRPPASLSHSLVPRGLANPSIAATSARHGTELECEPEMAPFRVRFRDVLAFRGIRRIQPLAGAAAEYRGWVARHRRHRCCATPYGMPQPVVLVCRSRDFTSPPPYLRCHALSHQPLKSCGRLNPLPGTISYWQSSLTPFSPTSPSLTQPSLAPYTAPAIHRSRPTPCITQSTARERCEGTYPCIT